jgi:hypothetical protein
MESLITIIVDPETKRAAGGKIQASSAEEEKVLSQALAVAVAAINAREKNDPARYE